MKKRKELFVLILCSCGICVNVSADWIIPPEVIAKWKAVESHIARICSEFGDDASSELCKVLEENIEDIMYVDRISNIFARDVLNPTVESDEGVIKMMRKVVDAYKDNLSTAGWGIMYLAVKGDESDLSRFSAKVNVTDSTIFRARVTGTNLFGTIKVQNESGGWNMNIIGGYSNFKPPFIPSATNTGPQALYVYEILKSFWEQNGEDESKIPPELLTLVVWFDAEGKPVCNVDLSKYGLTMPELPGNAEHQLGMEGERPREPGIPAVEKNNDNGKMPSPPSTAGSRRYLWLALAALILAIGGFYAWRKKK